MPISIKRVSSTVLAQSQSKRSRYQAHVEDTYVCVICQERKLLMCSSCPEHFACVPCMTKLISRTGKYESCPLCRHPMDEKKQPRIFHDEDLIYVTNAESLFPPIRDLNLMCNFSSGPIICPDCDEFSGTPREVLLHMFDDCDSFQFFCTACHVELTRDEYDSHLDSGECRNRHCLENDACEFMLYGSNDEKSVKLATHHKEMHCFHDHLSLLAGKVEKKMILVENLTVVNFRVQRVVDRLHRLYNRWTLMVVTLQNDCLSSDEMTHELIEMRQGVKKITNRLLAMIYALTIMFENETEEEDYEIEVLE